jgi:hypothetical protein
MSSGVLPIGPSPPTDPIVTPTSTNARGEAPALVGRSRSDARHEITSAGVADETLDASAAPLATVPESGWQNDLEPPSDQTYIETVRLITDCVQLSADQRDELCQALVKREVSRLEADARTTKSNVDRKVAWDMWLTRAMPYALAMAAVMVIAGVGTAIATREPLPLLLPGAGGLATGLVAYVRAKVSDRPPR